MKAFSLLLKCNWLSFTKRECLFTNVVGGPFTFLDQYARGTVEAMEPGVLIELNLQVSDWPYGHFSSLRFELSEHGSATQLNFIHDYVPVVKVIFSLHFRF